MNYDDRLRLMEARRQAIAAVVKKCAASRCACCRGSEYHSLGIYSLTCWAHDEIDQTTTVAPPPVVLIQCKGCGCIQMFNADAVGANPSPPK
jgi:hypothetical protein